MFRSTSFENIEEQANNILLAYNITECPAKHMKSIIDIQDIKFTQTNKFSEDTDGFYMVSENKKAILINKNIQPDGRKNFTIAHEIGHHFLKHCAIGQTIECHVDENTNYEEETSAEYKRKEQEANVFAASFLMPKHIVVPHIKRLLEMTDRLKYGRFFLDNQQCNYTDWNKCWQNLNFYFHTSQTCIKWRLYSLGYLHGPEFES